MSSIANRHLRNKSSSSWRTKATKSNANTVPANIGSTSLSKKAGKTFSPLNVTARLTTVLSLREHATGQGSESWKNSAGEFTEYGAQTGGISSNKKKKASLPQLTPRAECKKRPSFPKAACVFRICFYGVIGSCGKPGIVKSKTGTFVKLCQTLLPAIGTFAFASLSPLYSQETGRCKRLIVQCLDPSYPSGGVALGKGGVDVVKWEA